MNSFFDTAALNYDDTFTYSKIGKEQRKKVYQNLDYIFDGNKKLDVLELNCGTGLDAITFVEKGHRVIATDISKGMINVAQKKSNKENLKFEQLDVKVLEENYFNQKFDLVFSNFGGLNCLASGELKKLFKVTSKILKPNGKVTMVLMPKNCIWEQLYFFLKGDFKKSKRRNTNNALMVNVEGVQVPTWYYNPKDVEKISNDCFKVTKCIPVGITVPPSYLEKSLLTKSPIWNILKGFEKVITRVFFAKYADHFLIELTKK